MDRSKESLLPDHPSRMTFSGRYKHVDNWLIRKPLKLVLAGSTIRILDFGGGVLETGSPTAHDIHKALSTQGFVPDITVVDEYIPEGFHPIYGVKYVRSLGDVDGKFDLVRILRVREHVDIDVYDQIRQKVLKKLRIGGLFVVTQYSCRYRFNAYFAESEVRSLPQAIKVMQKKKWKLWNEMVPLVLLPDTMVPWGASIFVDIGQEDEQDRRELAEYAEFKENIDSGNEELNVALDIYGFYRRGTWSAVDAIVGRGIEHLNEEGPIVEQRKTTGKRKTMRQMRQYKQESPNLFLKGLR